MDRWENVKMITGVMGKCSSAKVVKKGNENKG